MRFQDLKFAISPIHEILTHHKFKIENKRFHFGRHNIFLIESLKLDYGPALDRAEEFLVNTTKEVVLHVLL